MNLRPRGPKPRALPDCATPRTYRSFMNRGDYIEFIHKKPVEKCGRGDWIITKAFGLYSFLRCSIKRASLFYLRSSFTNRLAASAPNHANHIKSPAALDFYVVGVTGFEPATSASRTLRATKLRYTPMIVSILSDILLRR